MSGGFQHWIRQRLTAVALVPLGVWFLLGLLRLPDGSHETALRWLAAPRALVLLSLFTATALWHSMQGVRVIVDDYVGGRLHRPTLVTLAVLHAALALAAAWAIATIARAGAA